MSERFWEITGPKRGKILGTVFGLVMGWIFIRYGLLRGLVVALCVVSGYFVGALFDSKSGKSTILDRFMR